MTRSAPPAASFLALLEKSTLLAADELERARKLIAAAPDAKTAANLLIQNKLLTRWQAAQILTGRTALTLGKYRLLERLGKGGMGSVYLAEHRQMKRRAAIKTLPVESHQDQAADARLLAEAQAIAMLDHRNIVHAFDLEVDGDLHFLVMEYVEGEDLQLLVERAGPLAFEQSADYMAQAAEGLAHIHSRGMVHRDIKPANLLLDRQGTIKITDLGLAHGGDGATSVPRPASQTNAIGTVDYLSPEQALDHDSADQRSDIYSLGCTFYFLLTGQPPFPEGSLAERLVKHQTEEPRSILKLRPDAPHDLVKTCRKMMAKKPDQRFASAKEVAALLRGWRPDSSDATQNVLEDPAVGRPKGTSDTAISRSSTSLNPNRAPQQPGPAGTSPAARQVGTPTPRGGMPVARSLDAQPAGVSGIRRSGTKLPSSSPGRSGVGASGIRQKKSKSIYYLVGALAVFLAVIVGMMVMVLNSSKSKPDAAAGSSGRDGQAGKSPGLPPAAATAGRSSGPPSRDFPPKTASPNQSDTTAKSASGTVATPAIPPVRKPEPASRPVPEPTPLSRVDPPKARPRGNAFRDLPQSVELPNIRRVNEEAPVELGKVSAPPDVQYEIELLGGDAAVAKGTGRFQMDRQEGDGSWLIAFESASDSSGAPIAVVRRNNGAVQFQWSAAAARTSAAEHLRNCVLQFSSGDSKHTLRLRKAKETAAITLDLSEEKATYPIHCEFLPEPESLFVEVLNLETSPGLDSEVRPTRAAVRTFAAKEPGATEPPTIYIGDPKVESGTKLLSVQLTCLVRGRTVRLETSPMYQSDDTWTPLVASKLGKAMDEVLGKVSQLKKRVTVLDPDRNKKELADSKKQLEEALATLKDLERLRAVYLAVHDKAKIHYRLIHLVGDHELVLLSTRASDTK